MNVWQFWIDVGGTFTDCIGRDPDGRILQHKTLSSGLIKGITGPIASRQVNDPRRVADPDRVWNGFEFRSSDNHLGRVEGFEKGVLYLDSEVPANVVYELSSLEPAPLVAIRYLLGCSIADQLPPMDIRLGTTRGTNALITRSGAHTALLTTRGYEDVLRIGYQARPHLFALDIQKPDEIYTDVVEVNERVAADGDVLTAVDEQAVRRDLQTLRKTGVNSLAIVLLHACSNPSHELLVGNIAKECGFANISLSHEVASLRKFVPRGDTTVIDAYLNPVLAQYIDTIKSALHTDCQLQLMTSSGALTSVDHFRGKDSILSGPAGGVVGVAKVASQAGYSSAIGFDMGGTSTDVSRWAGEFELAYENEKAGVRVVTPMMAIETVAAGGGSLCQFDGVKLTVGPESAGADPGPACYGKGGPLSVTDINVFVGKILPDEFPFDLEQTAVQRQLETQCRTIADASGKQYSPAELADGYLRIANTNMAEAIRCVSVDRGIDPRNDVLVAFGGAAGQHACAVANELGMSQILMHPYAGIMSAFGIGLAEVAVHREQGIYANLASIDASQLQQTFESLESDARRELQEHFRTSQRPLPEPQAPASGADRNTVTLSATDNANAFGSGLKKIRFSRYLDLRFVGLDEPIKIKEPANGDYQSAYEATYQSRCGYLPDDRSLEVVTARVTAVAESKIDERRSKRVVAKKAATHDATCEALFEGQLVATRIYKRIALAAGDKFHGPAIVTESISTIVVDPGWQAEVMSGGELLLCKMDSGMAPTSSQDDAERSDPVMLEVFNKRFAAIATQMGTTLRRTSRSVNVKERLDYSCAIFSTLGQLVVNAPHIPVHLGAMGATVRHVLATMDLFPGDSIVTNDPYHGGSHLPDVTVITPVHDASGELLFLTASRAHHAEIGGITPGSMPAFSKNLAEEGVLIRAIKVIDAGESRVNELRQLLQSSPYPSRNPEMNIADVTAQLAANRQGAGGLLQFVDEYSWPVVSRYMQFIQDAAAQKTRAALKRIPDGRTEFTDHLDDGSPITVSLVIQGASATLDFSGTGNVLAGNLNANKAIVTAAALYCLRLLINEDIPLNEGVLNPIQINLPTCLLNPTAHDDPTQCPAMVGGNVETSQRVVDVVLGALGIAAASQGTMNNFLFGDESFGYYETICGGAGATASSTGANAVHTHMTNTRLTDPEVLEHRFPVRLRRFQIRQGSGGNGIHRGGNGVIREVEFLAPLQVSLLTQRRGRFAPYGLAGGEPGKTGMNIIQRANGDVETLAGITSLNVEIGDVIRIETPGGGGWGNA